MHGVTLRRYQILLPNCEWERLRTWLSRGNGDRRETKALPRFGHGKRCQGYARTTLARLDCIDRAEKEERRVICQSRHGSIWRDYLLAAHHGSARTGATSGGVRGDKGISARAQRADCYNQE